jgi:hypothetical protein
LANGTIWLLVRVLALYTFCAINFFKKQGLFRTSGNKVGDNEGKGTVRDFVKETGGSA